MQIRNLVLSSFFFLFSAHTFALTLVTEFTSQKTIQEIVALTFQVEAQCQSGCEDYLPNVREQKKIDESVENELIFWTYVTKNGGLSFFSRMNVERTSDMTLIKSQMLNWDEAQSYQTDDHLHAPGPMTFNSMEMQVTQLQDGTSYIRLSLSAQAGRIPGILLKRSLSASLSAYYNMLQ